MKRVTIGMLAASIALAACGKEDDSKLAAEVKSLETAKADAEKEYRAIKEQNDKKDKEIKAKEKEIEKAKKEQQEALEKQIAAEEAAKKKAEEKAEKQAEALKKKQAEAEKAKKIMPNTIEASTNGTTKVVLSKEDIPLKLEDNGITVNIGQLQIFSVTDMPKDQVLLFDGATEGYVMLYQVTVENMTDQPLYYNNRTKLTIDKKARFSDFASFIPADYQENTMKKQEGNLYAAHEKTISYKSIALSKTDYEALQQGKASFAIQGGVSTSKDQQTEHSAESDSYTFK